MNAFTRLVIILLIGVCGYNWWQIRQLRYEVGKLQTTGISARHKACERHAASVALSAQSWLAQANQHMDSARVAMERSDFGTARSELERGGADLHNTVQQPETQTRAALDQARRSLADLQAKANGMVRNLHPSQPSGGR